MGCTVSCGSTPRARFNGLSSVRPYAHWAGEAEPWKKDVGALQNDLYLDGPDGMTATPPKPQRLARAVQQPSGLLPR